MVVEDIGGAGVAIRVRRRTRGYAPERSLWLRRHRHYSIGWQQQQRDGKDASITVLSQGGLLMATGWWWQWSGEDVGARMLVVSQSCNDMIAMTMASGSSWQVKVAKTRELTKRWWPNSKDDGLWLEQQVEVVVCCWHCKRRCGRQVEENMLGTGVAVRGGGRGRNGKRSLFWSAFIGDW